MHVATLPTSLSTQLLANPIPAPHPPPPLLLQLDSSEEWRAATTEEQREVFAAQLTDTEDWLYGDGEAVDVAEYRCTQVGGFGWGQFALRCWLADANRPYLHSC